MKISKSDLSGRVENHILSLLPDGLHEVSWVNPETLLTWSRLDVATRCTYLDLKDSVPELAKTIYWEDIRAQSLGLMEDPDNSLKVGFGKFIEVFDSISQKIELSGFDIEQTIIPISSSGSILNGSHRLSAALHHGVPVATLQTTLPPIIVDYRNLWERGMSVENLEIAVTKMVSIAENCFVAFLWPSGSSKLKVTEKVFTNIIYKKKLDLSMKGKVNLLAQCYRHMDWVGVERSGYQGLKQKLTECFTSQDETVMIVFQSPDGIEGVRKIKEEIRKINSIGFSSIHITDNSEETHRIVNLLCNANGMHYLNNADLIQESQIKKLQDILNNARKSGINSDDFILDGSWLLEIYGLRKAQDIDLLIDPKYQNTDLNIEFGDRLNQIQYHGLSAIELINNPQNYFVLYGVKTIGFMQLLTMKKNRSERKDILDVQLMNSITKKGIFKRKFISLQQKAIFFRIRNTHKTKKFFYSVIKTMGLYPFIRHLYIKFIAAKVKSQKKN